MPTNKTLIFAHRGSAGTHPENTMVAFQAAQDIGAEGIELDVQLTKDQIPVIIHDEMINRTTNGSGWVKDFTYEEIKEFDAGSWFASSFKQATIPSLEELLQWAASSDLLLNIELKTGVVRYPGIEKIVIDLVKKYHLVDRVILSSFNHYSLVEIRKFDSSIETAILFMEGLFEPWNYAKVVGATSLHCYLPVATPELLKEAKAAGVPVRPFTVNDMIDIQSLLQNNCSAIITDWPEKALTIRETLVQA